jgi:hypothetical protein
VTVARGVGDVLHTDDDVHHERCLLFYDSPRPAVTHRARRA